MLQCASLPMRPLSRSTAALSEVLFGLPRRGVPGYRPLLCMDNYGKEVIHRSGFSPARFTARMAEARTSAHAYSSAQLRLSSGKSLTRFQDRCMDGEE